MLGVLLQLVLSTGYAARDVLDEQSLQYDPAVPSMQEVLGYAYGEQISSHHQIVTYVQALAAANPDRMRLIEYATSWEGRKLYYMVISSRQNIARLTQHQLSIQQLAHPGDLSTESTTRLIEDLPATTWLAYGVHADEISSSDAALHTAYHLLASREDDLVDKILNKTLVFIDPLQNPDGHDRFVNHFRLNRGLQPDNYAYAAERIQEWPGSRTNHYFFDMNRDWFAMTQPETKGRIRVLQEWYPLIFVDFHEMDLDSTYFFPPTAPPVNPWSSPQQVNNFALFGKNNAAWFDRYGIDYFTREIFDYFYPGYGDSWPGYYGSIGMTYEQASVRGLVGERLDGSQLTFRQSVQHHFITSLATLETSAENRVKLFEEFVAFRRSAIEKGKRDVRSYILPLRGDISLVHKLAGLLASQGVKVKQSTEPLRTCGDYPTGSYVIPLDQPSHRLIRVLLDESVEMSADFIKEQERRRATWIGHELYDVTAWSIPLMFNIEAVPCSKTLKAALDTADDFAIQGQLSNPDASVAFVVPWGTVAAGRLLTAALNEDLHILSNDKPFTLENREFPAGSLIFKVADNPRGLAEKLKGLAHSSGSNVIGINSSWIEQGINFGSEYVVRIKPIRIAMLWNSPTSAYSAGATRFVLEQQFKYPVTVIPTSQVSRADLFKFDVLIMPAGKYHMRSLEAKLLNWVSEGGTLIALEEAVSSISSTKLLDIKEEYLAAGDSDENNQSNKKLKKEKEKIARGSILTSKEDYLDAIEPEKEKPDSVPGVLLKAEVDRDHWLSSGLPDTVNVLFNGNRIYTPITLDKGINVLRYPAEEDLLASGYLWQENRRQIAFKPFVVAQKHKRGLVIAFTSSPTTRAYQDGLNLLLLNAVFRGPAHTY
jgi:hypothetical protein